MMKHHAFVLVGPGNTWAELSKIVDKYNNMGKYVRVTCLGVDADAAVSQVSFLCLSRERQTDESGSWLQFLDNELCTQAERGESWIELLSVPPDVERALVEQFEDAVILPVETVQNPVPDTMVVRRGVLKVLAGWLGGNLFAVLGEPYTHE